MSEIALPGMSLGSRRPAPRAVLELLKPITWFAPMWAFGCGVVSSDVALSGHWPRIVAGVLLAGPCVCATSQATNDWYDRHVDAINEPGRPIPSGRIPGSWGFIIACVWTVLSLLVGSFLGVWAWGATCVGLALAWAYSAPPLRLKMNGWWGNSAVAACYEGLPWFTGAAVMAGHLPPLDLIIIAALYSAGAHGIMTLNDFKSIEGDRAVGIGSLPARLGAALACRIACVAMALPQVVVIALLLRWGFAYHAAIIVALLGAQVILMTRLLDRPRELAPWYNATGTSLYVLGMLAAAFALRAMPGLAPS